MKRLGVIANSRRDIKLILDLIITFGWPTAAAATDTMQNSKR